MASPPLEKEIRVLLTTERRIMRQLSRTYIEVGRRLKALEGKSGPTAIVSRAQAQQLRSAIAAEMADFWRAAGNEIRAGRLDAASEAGDMSSEIDSLFRKAGLSSADIGILRDSMRSSARSTINSAMQRIKGDSYKPLSSRVYDTQSLTNGMLDRTINNALTRGATAAELAKDVRQFIRPDTPGGVSYAARRLGRTEINNAYHAASLEKSRKSPFVETVTWELSGSHTRPDECNEYAEGTHFPGGNPGEYMPAQCPDRPHPNCMCYTMETTPSDEAFIRAFNEGKYDDWLREEGMDPGEVFRISPSNSIREYAWGVGEKAPLVYNEVNSALRAGRALTGKAKRVAEGLDHAFELARPTSSRMVLHRQLPGADEALIREVLRNARAGNEWRDPAFMSTTRNLDLLEDFDIEGTGVRLDLHVPPGTKLIHVDDYIDEANAGVYAQNEWLLPRNTRLVLRNARRTDDGWVVDAHVVPEGQKKPVFEAAKLTKSQQIEKLERSIQSEIARGKKGNATVAAAARVNVNRMRAELRQLKR